jgi:hypothetical protein
MAVINSETTKKKVGQETLFRSLLTDLQALVTQFASYKTIVDELKTRVNAIYTNSGSTYVKTAPVLSATTGAVTLHSTAFDYVIGGTAYSSAAADTAFTGGGAHDVATGSKFASFKISISTAGVITITPSAALNYATEALAIAAVPATPAGECSMGYITVKSHAGAIWDATTDALTGGTGGTPSPATGFYSATVPTGFGQVATSSPSAVTLATTT